MVWGLFLVGEVGVVLWLVGPVGCLWWGSVLFFLLGGIRAQRALPPLGEGHVILFFI